MNLAGEYGLELRQQYDGNIVTWNSDYGWMIFVGKKRLQSQVGFVVGNFSRKTRVMAECYMACLSLMGISQIWKS